MTSPRPALRPRPPSRPPRRLPGLRWGLGAALLGALCCAGAGAEAEAPAPLPALTRSDLELLPLDEVARTAFQRAHAGFLQRLELLVARAERVEQNLRERERPDARPDPGVLVLREELARLHPQIELLLPELVTRLVAAGVPEDALERARRAPRGPQRADRFGLVQVLAAPGLEEPARGLLAALVPAVDGALLALEGECRRLRAAEGEAATALHGVADRLAARQRQLLKRFWRVADAVLTTPQRAAVVRRLPTALRKKEDAVAHVYLLPGLTPSQGVRFKALLLEAEAEAAADTAELRQHQDALGAGGLADADRRRHEQALAEAGARLADLQARLQAQGLALLTPEQVEELVGVPPHVSGADRREPPQNALAELSLDAAQRGRLAALATRYLGTKRELEGGYLELQRRLAEAGPDSPDREMAEMQAAALGGRVVVVLREAYAEVFLRVLRTEQVLGWVLCADAR